ncbi:MAG TPA: EpsG family protein [Xanthomonadaceae bacterium]|jgi:hypothetical protein
MWPYWLMFLTPMWAVLTPGRLLENQARWVWFLIGCVFAVLIGFRHQVGGDWGTYVRHFNDTVGLDWSDVVSGTDPGYYAVNWLVARAGGTIYTVNLICGAVVMWGTVVFCRRQPNPWLALLVAVPYMLIVVAMGYTRQAAALGFALLGLSALGAGKVRTFAMWIAVGALFHKSAVLLLPIAALAASRNRFLTALLIGILTALLYYLLVADASESLWNSYVVADYQSQGGPIRVLMNVLPAMLLVLFGRQLVEDPHERKLWLWMSVMAFICLPLVTMASTAVDRVALYLIPLQLFVFARMPLLAKAARPRTPIVLGVIGYYAAVEYVWLNYAADAGAWVPYHFMPMGS